MSDASDVGAPYERADGKLSMRVVLYGLAQTLGLYTPARDIYLDYFFGSDATPSTITVAATPGLWLDMGAINASMRQLVIQNGNAAPSYQYSIRASRNGLDADSYEIKAAGGIGEVTAEFEALSLDGATYGYDQYIQIIITPAAGQTGTQLDFIAYLTGRGG